MSENASGALASIRWPRPFDGLRGLKLADVPREVSAGVTLAALMIPLNIGYAQVAGLPPVFGLYAGIIPLAVFALFTSSRHVVGSPDAPISAILGAMLIGFAPIGDPMRAQYALALALVCGLLFFVFWFFRLAFLANFLSRAVLAGFITGLGIEVLTNQIRRILGASHGHAAGIGALAEQVHDSIATSVNTTGYFAEVVVLIESIPRANLYSVAVGVGAFAIVRLMKRFAPKAPAALIALALTTIAVGALGLDAKGVTVLGKLQAGLPSLTVPGIPVADYLRVLPGALAIVGITMCEALLLVRSCGRRHDTKADGDQVMFAYGMASVASGFTGSLVSGPSASRTAAMEAAGSRTQLSSLVAAATVALVMVFFTGQLAYLPTAALAGVVANAVLNLIEVKELRELWVLRRSEFWVAMVCLLSVLVFGPMQAVVIAFLMATIDLLRRASRPGTWVLKEAPDGSHFVSEDEEHAADTPGLLIYRFGAPLYFANAPLFEEEVEKVIARATSPVKWFVLDAEAMVDIDTTGEQALHEVASRLAKRGVIFAISRANQSTLSWLSRYHLLTLIGKDRLYPTNRHAAQAFRQVEKA
ncbi:MAG: SulP family inorganic anion transporter [Acidobacteria bacterium]|nr:SulP family inorganic anion transporter [Acidobacteriota bacterium]